MNLTVVPISVRLFAYLVVLCLLIWRYRRNRVIAFGILVLGCAALAVLMSLVRGVPDWLVGIVVLFFLLMAIAMVPVALFFVIRHLRRRSPQAPPGI